MMCRAFPYPRPKTSFSCIIVMTSHSVWWWSLTSHNLHGRKAFLPCSSTSFAGGRGTEMHLVSICYLSPSSFSKYVRIDTSAPKRNVFEEDTCEQKRQSSCQELSESRITNLINTSHPRCHHFHRQRLDQNHQQFLHVERVMVLSFPLNFAIRI